MSSTDNFEGINLLQSSKSAFKEKQASKVKPVKTGLLSYELVALRQQELDDFYKDKANCLDESSNSNTDVDVLMTIRDIDYIDPVDSSFRCSFTLHGIYLFDEQTQRKDLRDVVEEDDDNSKNSSVTGGHRSRKNTIGGIEEKELEEDMGVVGLAYAIKRDDNIFFKLRKAKPTVIQIEGQDVAYRQYILEIDEIQAYLRRYNIPTMQVENIKQKVVGEIINWDLNVKITIYHESKVGAHHDTGVLSVMIYKEYEYYLKEIFELQNFPFDYQDLSIELSIDEGENFDFCVNDIRFRKAALEDQEWTILEPTVTWYHPFATEICLRAKRRPIYYIQNVILVMFVLTLLGLTSYALPIDQPGDRLNIQITLILTVVAFKFVLATQIPKTSYNTLLDYFMSLCTLTLSANCIGVLACTRVAGHEDESYTIFVDAVIFYCFFGWIVFYTIIWFIYSYIQLNLTEGVIGSKVINFNPKDDSDEMYDYTLDWKPLEGDGFYHEIGTARLLDREAMAKQAKQAKQNLNASGSTGGMKKQVFTKAGLV